MYIVGGGLICPAFTLNLKPARWQRQKLGIKTSFIEDQVPFRGFRGKSFIRTSFPRRRESLLKPKGQIGIPVFTGMTVNQAMVKGQNLKKFRTAKVEIDEIHDSSTSTPPFLKRGLRD